MPSKEMHDLQYRHNREMLNSSIFDRQHMNYNDWYITIMFYGAMHLVEEHLSESDIHSSNHEMRNVTVMKTTPLNKVATDYITLYNQSRRARYDCVKFSQADLKLLEDCMYRIERVLTKQTAK